MATVLIYAGVAAILGGIVAGLAMYEISPGGYSYRAEYDYSILWSWIAAGVVSGILLLGFAEVINLLDKINNKLEKESASEEDVEGDKERVN